MQNRPFENIQEMNQILIQNYNAVVHKNDTVYILGDISHHLPMDRANELISRLNGKKILIKGNHDKKDDLELFEEICDFKTVSLNGLYFALMYYPMLSWPKKNSGSIQLHGHIHAHEEYNLQNKAGEAIPLVSETHKSSDFVTFLKKLDEKYPKSDMIRIILDNHSAHTSKETQEYLNTVSGRFEFVFTPKHGSWLNMIEGFFSKMTKQMLGGIRVESKKELEDRIYRYFDEINKEPVPYKWTYKMDTIDLSQEDIDSIVYEVVNEKAASAENKNKKAPKTISRKRKSIQN